MIDFTHFAFAAAGLIVGAGLGAYFHRWFAKQASDAQIHFEQAVAAAVAKAKAAQTPPTV